MSFKDFDLEVTEQIMFARVTPGFNIIFPTNINFDDAPQMDLSGLGDLLNDLAVPGADPFKDAADVQVGFEERLGQRLLDKAFGSGDL